MQQVPPRPSLHLQRVVLTLGEREWVRASVQYLACKEMAPEPDSP
jgi:hypothetical protein